jgi:hypothetical protein
MIRPLLSGVIAFSATLGVLTLGRTWAHLIPLGIQMDEITLAAVISLLIASGDNIRALVSGISADLASTRKTLLEMDKLRLEVEHLQRQMSEVQRPTADEVARFSRNELFRTGEIGEDWKRME